MTKHCQAPLESSLEIHMDPGKVPEEFLESLFQIHVRVLKSTVRVSEWYTKDPERVFERSCKCLP